MKQLLFIFLILFSYSLLAQDKQDEDVQCIYAAVIAENFKNEIIVIEDSTSVGLHKANEYSYKRFKSYCESISQETFNDFVAKNIVPSKIELQITIDKEIIIITSDQITEIFNKDNGWDVFYNKYGDKAQGILRLSRIGFNKDKTQAFLYYGNQSDWLTGGGRGLLYEKVEGQWKRVCGLRFWIS